MADSALRGDGETDERLVAEIVRLRKIVKALMNRAERSASTETSNFGLFQTTIILEEQVRHKTFELETALRENERINRDLQQIQAKLQEQAIRDPLTGLYNRHYLNEALGRELDRARRQDLRVGVVLADIDHFKVVNDTYGHTAGDEVLKTVGALLQRSLREYDFSCRYGGEEFLMILPGIEPNSTRKRIEQVRAAVETTKIRYDASVIEVTASFGIAMFPANGGTGAALIAAADSALYKAKNGGRNRVDFYDSQTLSCAETVENL
jgi:diguanylate cyclase (GGDEF)-like protein